MENAKKVQDVPKKNVINMDKNSSGSIKRPENRVGYEPCGVPKSDRKAESIAELKIGRGSVGRRKSKSTSSSSGSNLADRMKKRHRQRRRHRRRRADGFRLCGRRKRRAAMMVGNEESWWQRNRLTMVFAITTVGLVLTTFCTAMGAVALIKLENREKRK